MTWPVVLAACCAGIAVFLVVAPNRYPASGTAVGPPAPARRLPVMLRAIEGAPSLVTRCALAVTVASVILLTLAGVGGAGPPIAVVAGGVAFVAAGRYRPPAARSREAALSAALPPVCTLLAVCLEAGLPLRNAVPAVAESLGGPAGAALRRLDAAVRLGQPEADAWRELGERHPAFESLVAELRHALGNGVSVAPVLRRHAHDAQSARHAAAEARARRAGVTTVLPLVVCFLPAFLVVGVVPIVGGVLGRLFG